LTYPSRRAKRSTARRYSDEERERGSTIVWFVLPSVCALRVQSAAKVAGLSSTVPLPGVAFVARFRTPRKSGGSTPWRSRGGESSQPCPASQCPRR
jgi:hypothetical protein